MTPQNSDPILKKGNEDLLNSASISLDQSKIFKSDAPLGRIPDWLSNRKPVPVTLVRLMMLLFMISIAFNAAGALIGNVSAAEYWRRMAVPLTTTFTALLGFFVNQFWLVPRYFFEKRFKLFVLFNLLFTLFSIGLRDAANLVFDGAAVPVTSFFVDKVIYRPAMGFLAIFIFLLITTINCVFNVLLRLGGIRVQNEYRKRAQESFYLQADLAFLKQQLSSHFLFNTLNNITALMDIEPKLAQKSMIQLSWVLRQILNESKEREVPLENELDILQKYCELEKLRFGPNMQFTLNTQVEKMSVKITPLLLMPLLENAMKYGVHPSKPCFIHIDIHENADKLICRVENSISRKKESSTLVKSGIGLSNLKRRLELCYPGAYTYTVNETESVYAAELEIDLSKLVKVEE